VSRFRFVSEFAPDYGVKRLCRVLKISRSGYYAWARRGPSTHQQRDVELTELITEIHRRSRTTYGSPRVHAELRRLDQRCGRKRVARLMAREGLVGAHARRRWRTGKPDVAPAPDLVNRNFGPPRADRLWAADVTQFWTQDGWLYFAGVVDLYSRRVVGWAMANSPDADLVIDALMMAFERRRPDKRLIHHSDRGAVGEINWSSQHLESGGDRWRPCESDSERSSFIADTFPRRGDPALLGERTEFDSGRRSLAA
jgi:putative transposase